MVRCALNAVLDVNLKNIDTSRVQCMREVGKSVLESVTVGERDWSRSTPSRRRY